MLLATLAALVLTAEPSAPPLVPVVDEAPPPPMVEAAPAPASKRAPTKTEVHQQPRIVLIGAGAALFALSWGVSVLIAAVSENPRPFPGQVTNLWPLSIPLAGPVVAGFTGARDSTIVAALLIDGLAQVGGVVMLIAGIAMPVPQKQRAWLTPMVAPGLAGARFGVQF